VYRVMNPNMRDLVESPRYQEVCEFDVNHYATRTEVCRGIYNGAKVVKSLLYGSELLMASAVPSPFLPCCRSIERAVRMRDEAERLEDAGKDIKARFGPKENRGRAVIVKIDIASMLEEDEMLGVIDMSSEEAVDMSL
jgi:hypothetical protein